MKNVTELKSHSDTTARATYQQYTPTRDVTKNNFSAGSIHIPFAISGLTWWNPSQTYLRIRCTLTRANGDPLEIGDGIGPSMNTAASLFQNCEFRINGKTISTINSFVPQIDVLKSRMTRSKSWIDSVGASLNFMGQSLDQRIQEVSNDGSFISSASPPSRVTSREDLGYNGATTLELKQEEIVITGPDDIDDNVFESGDYIKITSGDKQGNEYLVLSSTLITNADNESVLTLGIQFAIAQEQGVVNFERVRKFSAGMQSRRVSEFELCWQPPLSIFGVHHAMPVGNYELVLTPQSVNQLQSAVVESFEPKNPLTDFKFMVEEMYLFVHQMAGPRVDSTSYYLDLESVRCQTSQLDSANFGSKSFDVSPSTHALTVAYQDGRLDDTLFSASIFDFSVAKSSLSLERFYIDYAGQQRPSPDADPKFQPNIDLTTQRYLETIMGTGMYWECGGAESLSDWQQRGAYYYFPWPRDGSDQSNRVRVHQSFRTGTDVTNGRVLLFDHSRQVCNVNIKDGRVVDVMIQDV